ncbi:MAG: M1 family metallopeptidase, partial [Planctomycetes bacterium]|nr:M1 family metallopeptidase [Planctomycetota bacterium]
MAASLPAQMFGNDEFARKPGPRPDHTIFSPLDLPAPNRMRTGSGAPGPDYWQQQVDYRIDVALEPETRTVRGQERVTYHNNSPDPLDYLWVHLEQNILKPDSIGALTDGGAAVGGPSDAGAGVVVAAVTAGGQPLEHHVYDTLMRVHLPAPLPPGSRFECDIGWSFQVPDRVFRRYGTMQVSKGTIWELAQWFPAVAVYDDVHGWNTLPYLGTGEFYTNFGNYELNITAPRDHLVVATGVLQNPREVYTATQLQRLAKARQSAETVMIRTADEVGDPSSRPAGSGPLTWRFRSENVRTVAFASSEAFLLDAAGYGDTLVQSAYSEDSLPVWGKSTAMLRAAIAGYSERIHPYPYPVATNVGGVEGGMEYPMIIFCSGRNRKSEGGLYGVTTHEIGHNWFPMLVNTDERRHAWMDEGFNTFINEYSTADWFKGKGPGKTGTYAGMMRMPGVPIVTQADRLNGLQLGLLQYKKTGVGMQILREYVLGEERFDFAFRTYVRRWAFKSPQPADFFRTMEDAAGMDLAWFWRGWFLEDAMLDQAIDSVRQATKRRGAQITFINNERMVMPLSFEV